MKNQPFNYYDRIRVFSVYIGATIDFKDLKGGGTLIGVVEDIVHFINNQDPNGRHTDKHGTMIRNTGAVLLLKPLTEISDQDKKKVIAILVDAELFDFTLWSISPDFCDFVPTPQNSWPTPRQIQEVTDFLRSRGYALPYLNYRVGQLVEAGIYKLKIEN